MAFIEVNVPVLIEEGSEQHERLLTLARDMKLTFDQMVEWAVNIGVYHHINDNLTMIERTYQKGACRNGTGS